MKARYDAILKWLQTPIFDDEENNRVARTLDLILRISIILTISVGVFANQLIPDPIIIWLFLIIQVIAYAMIRAHSLKAASFTFLLSTWFITIFFAFQQGGLTNPILFFAPLTVITTGLLLHERDVYGITILYMLSIIFIFKEYANPVNSFGDLRLFIFLSTSLLLLAMLTNLSLRKIWQSMSNLRKNEEELLESNRRLNALRSNLETRIVERTIDLERKAMQLQTASEVVKDVASIRDLKILLSKVCVLISERFDFYHTGIFLIDYAENSAVLNASNSQGGEKMLARGHKLRIGSGGDDIGQGIVGYVATTGNPRTAMNVGKDSAFFSNDDLPDTKSEMALPLIAGGEIFGVLDIQSLHQQAFKKEDITILQTLADQVAIAIDNARLFNENQNALEATRRAFGELSNDSWKKIISSQNQHGYKCLIKDYKVNKEYPANGQKNLASSEKGSNNGSKPNGKKPSVVIEKAAGPWEFGMLQAHEIGGAVLSDPFTLSLPVKIRDQAIGVIKLRKSVGSSKWKTDEVTLFTTLVDRLGEALEAARLYQETHRRAERERLASTITSKMRASNDPEAILRTAVTELRQALQVSQAQIVVWPKSIDESGVTQSTEKRDDRKESLLP